MGTATRTAHGEGDAPIAGAPIVIARLSRGFVVTHRVERASLPADLLQAHQTLAPNIELDASTAHRTALLRVADVSRPRKQADLPTSVAEDGRVKAAVAGRAVSAAISVAESFDLAVDDAVVLNDSNRLVVRLMPCDVIARVVPLGYRVFAAAVGAEREVQVVRRLAAADAPLAALDRRVEPRVFVRDGFEIELLTYYEPVSTRALSPEDYANALKRLHGAMRQIDVETPRFTDRVADVEQWVARRDATPDLTDEDRVLIVRTLSSLRKSVVDRRASEQLLHGEPHPWNVLDTKSGPRFVDFENCVRGPVEWDLGWVPAAVSERYLGADRDLVVECRGLVLAIVAAHCWRSEDERPGREARTAFMNAVRKGPPWTALDAV